LGTAPIEELSRAAPEVRFLSFLFARLVLSAAASPAPLRRWAVAESKRSHARLRSSSIEELGEVARRLGYPITELASSEVALALTDYVRLAVPIRDAEFRLGSQDVRHGQVEVSRERAARLLQEAVRSELARPMPIEETTRAAIRAREAVVLEEISQRVPLPVARPGANTAELRPDRFPPCIRRMRRVLEHGENLSHAGRFALAAFLHRAGADLETIVDAYRGAPDFDESITRYQIDHITHRDGGKGYEPPECATLRTHGLCTREGDPAGPTPMDRARDPLCFEPFLRHPLQYYRLRGGRVLEGGEGREDGRSPTGRPGGGSGTGSGPERTPSTDRRQ
ncbi:MAG: hypothetical protein HKL79_02730, partial [Thermoplasmata archaeon]|nr:hypothetical protein [Thermoplasmata archaeon]